MDNKTRNVHAIAYGLIVLLAGFGAWVYIASPERFDVSALRSHIPFLSDCNAPVRYTIGTYDERFGLSRTDFAVVLAESAALWNNAAGKTVIEPGTDNAVAINLVYSDYQRNAQLGKSIDSEQRAYNNKRTEVEGLREDYEILQARFESREAAFNAASAEYDKDVAYWNARGGAPPGEYERLERDQARLVQQQSSLNRLAEEVNAMARELNAAVDELNRLAAQTNAKVGVYNKTAGTDFDQGTYTENAEGKSIDIYEFTNRLELKRLLAHEFGHALGLGHTENAESIMYSYNIGGTFSLSREDIAAFTEVCGVE